MSAKRCIVSREQLTLRVEFYGPVPRPGIKLAEYLCSIKLCASSSIVGI